MKWNTDTFSKRSNQIHNYFYDYSNVVYKNVNCRVNIICPNHGEFKQQPSVHLKGHGCPRCAVDLNIKSFSSTIEDFINRSKLIHGNLYDYSKVVYKNRTKKVEIICSLHGSFFQQPYNHINKHGCPKCATIKTSRLTKMGKEKFVNRSKLIHGDKYNYDEVVYKNIFEKVSIICIKHGIFNQRPHDHINGVGCPKCNFSKGERKIFSWLEDRGYEFIHNKKMSGCINPKTGYHLRFDFFIPKLNLLIEFDGIQHFKKSNYGNLENIKYLDKIKDDYSKNVGIKLLRINYNQISLIENILNIEILHEPKK